MQSQFSLCFLLSGKVWGGKCGSRFFFLFSFKNGHWRLSGIKTLKGRECFWTLGSTTKRGRIHQSRIIDAVSGFKNWYRFWIQRPQNTLKLFKHPWQLKKMGFFGGGAYSQIIIIAGILLLKVDMVGLPICSFPKSYTGNGFWYTMGLVHKEI